MKAIILAAGYATRLYPLTKDFPKPLLQVGGKTILDHLVDQMEGIPALDQIVLITNSRFQPAFERWRAARPNNHRIHVLDDGTTRNDDRLGALGDLRLALERTDLQDDLLVSAADNILEFSLADFAATFQAHPAPYICVHWLNDAERCRRTGIAVLDDVNRVVEFAEKPRHPKTQWAVPPLYLFPPSTLRRLAEYLEAGGSPDAPGHFLEWLCHVEPVFAWKIPGTILDIGTPQSLEAARKLYKSHASKDCE